MHCGILPSCDPICDLPRADGFVCRGSKPYTAVVVLTAYNLME